MKTRRTVVAVVCAMAATACAGPGRSLEVGVKDVPVDIVLGAPQQSPVSPPLGAGPITGFPGFIAPPAPDPGDHGGWVINDPPASACPIGNPLDAAQLVARKEAPLPPVEQTYAYRNQGTLKVGDGATTVYPKAEKRTVSTVRKITAGTYEFDVAADLLGTVTTTTYRVINDGATPDRGAYIAGIVTRRADGSAEAFTPDRPLLLLPFPPPEYGTNLEDEIDRQRGTSYTSSGTDPLSQTTMLVEARVVGKERVDACGEWVDAFDVEVTNGRIVGPTKNITFTGHFLVATQYGGLVVEDNLHFVGTDGSKGYESKNRSRINVVPRAPRA